MSRQRLHIISHSFPNSLAPYDATFIHDHANVLSDDFEVTVTVPTPWSIPLTNRYKKNHSELILPNKVSGDRFYYLSFPGKKLPSIIQKSLSKRLLKYIEDKTPSLIHIHFSFPSGLAIPALKRHLGCPVVLTVHGSIFYNTVNKPGLAAILETSLEKADVIVAVGPNLKDNILEKFPHLNPKLKTIYNFVDTDFFKPKTQNAFPPSKNDPDKRFQLLTIANLRHTKGIDTLIDAVKLLDDDTNIQLSIIGRLDDESDFKNKIIAKIKSLDLNSIRLLGPKNRKEILHWMHKSDGFVLPSRKEAFGISLIEAMASGLPVVSTKSGGPEIILSEGWGYLVEPDSPVQLAEAIKKLTELESFDAEGQHKYIEENFGKKRYINEHTKLYNSLISS